MGNSAGVSIDRKSSTSKKWSVFHKPRSMKEEKSENDLLEEEKELNFKNVVGFLNTMEIRKQEKLSPEIMKNLGVVLKRGNHINEENNTKNSGK